MTWPTVAVTTTNTDAGTDSPASARSDILDALQKLNQMMAHVSTYAATLLDDTSASAARTTLGALGTSDTAANSQLLDSLDSTQFVRNDNTTVGTADLNTLTTSGFFRFDIPSAHGPGFSYSQLIVSRGLDTASQIAIDFQSGTIRRRSASALYTTPVWTAWETVIDSSSIASQSVSHADTAGSIGTAVATTSGTAIDFTSIPAGAKRITMRFNGVSTNGTSNLMLQIGSGSFTTSGYLGSTDNGLGGGAWTGTGAQIISGNAASVFYGKAEFEMMVQDASWVHTHLLGRTDSGVVTRGAGYVPVSGVIDRIRLTTVNGTDTFDAGSVNISWG